MKSLVNPQMAVRSLIKVRPMAVGLLDKRRVKYWDILDRSVEDVVQRDSVVDLLDEVAYTKVPAQDTDWPAMPLYWLIDYLTECHRGFLLQDLGDIGHLLDIHSIADSEESGSLRGIHKAFQEFTRDLQSHVEEEEAHLFPKLLRYEACLRDSRVHPEFHRGSLQGYTAIRLSQEDKRLYGACDALTDRLRAHLAAHADSFAASELLGLLASLREKLRDHGDLENRILFPSGREMERNLYNLSINGDPQVAFHRRGPMDSGILRLEDA